MNSKKSFGMIILGGILGLTEMFSPVSARSSDLKKQDLSICEIVKNEERFIGKSIELVAIYKTDNATYAYFTDSPTKDVPCEHPQIMEGQSASLADDPTVKSFLKNSMDICNDGAGSCIQSAIVHFRARVEIKDGSSYLFLTRIYSYRYIENYQM